jgi:hypothetical protein
MLCICILLCIMYHMYIVSDFCQNNWKNMLTPNNSPRVLRYVAPLGHIIPFGEPLFALSVKCCGLSGETTTNHLIVAGLTRRGFETTIYRTWGEHTNHYPSDAIPKSWYLKPSWIINIRDWSFSIILTVSWREQILYLKFLNYKTIWNQTYLCIQ